MKNESEKLTAVIKESLYRITKKDLPFTPFNYYKIFTEVALEYGMNETSLHKLLYSNTKVGEESVEEMKQKVLDIAKNVKDITLDIESSLEKRDSEQTDIFNTIESIDMDRNLMNEIDKIKYINMSLKSELESARNALEKQRKAIDSLKELSLKDHLTGLYLRRFMNKVLDEAFYNFSRYSRTFSIIMLDLDNFKNINDMYGHIAGDVVLQDFAKMIQKMTRYTDSCIRYGGDEFIIILPDTNLEEAKKVALKIQSSLKSVTFKKGIMEFKCSVSIGITSVRKNDTIESILERVDEALYKTKHDGKSGITIL